MRTAFVAFAVAIGALAFALSWVHTHELYVHAGFSDTHAHLGVALAESLVLFGTLGYLFGLTSRPRALWAIAIGIAIVGCANVAVGAHLLPIIPSWATGLLIGASIPVSLIVAEGMVKGVFEKRAPEVTPHANLARELQFPVAPSRPNPANHASLLRELHAPRAIEAAPVFPPATAHSDPSHSIAQRRAQVARLREAGNSITQIARKVNASRKTVYNDLQSA